LVEYSKSDAIPEENDHPLKEVVGDTFSKIVMDQSKDVLVFWWSPFCPKCKELMPVYEEVANRLKDVKHLIIAKFNGITNDVTQFPVDDFPSIKFFPARAKNAPLNYRGALESDSIVDYLKSKATWAKWPRNSDDLWEKSMYINLVSFVVWSLF